MRVRAEGMRELARKKTGHDPESPDSKGRRGGLQCPVCLAVLTRIAKQRSPARKCLACGAAPSAGRRCARCAQEAVWESGSAAGCASCGHHGSKVRVIAGHEWLSEGKD